MWPALPTEAEKIQTNVIVTPLGNREQSWEREGLHNSLGQGGSSAFTLSGLFEASQVVSGPWKRCLALWGVGMATVWLDFCRRS